MSILDKMVTQIRVDTTWLPPIIMDQPFSSNASVKGSSPWLELLKPKISVTPSGMSPVVASPWGDPGTSKWPILQAAIGVGLLVGIAYLVGRK